MKHSKPQGSAALPSCGTITASSSLYDRPGTVPYDSITELIRVDHIRVYPLPPNQSCALCPDIDQMLVVAASKGSAELCADAFHGRLFHGQAILLPPGSTCVCSPTQPESECTVATVSGTLIPTTLSSLWADEKLFCAAGLVDLREVAHRLVAAGDSTELLSLAAYELLMRLRASAEPFQAGSGYPLLVDAAIGIMQEEFAYLSGVEEISDRLGVTTAHLTRQFSQAVGVPPGRFLKAQKLSFAKQLLTLPEMTVSLAASMSGFPDGNYFSKVFRKEIGMPPSEYRRLHLADQLDESFQELIREIYL